MTAKTPRCGTHVPKICPCEYYFYFSWFSHGTSHDKFYSHNSPHSLLIITGPFFNYKSQRGGNGSLRLSSNPFLNHLTFLYQNRGMLSNSVQPPTVEHVYAQWQERKKVSSVATRTVLHEKDGHSRDVKEEDSASLSGDLSSHNHFRSSRAVRLKGNPAGI